MKDLKNIILSAQESDEKSMMDIITIFNPIINKYTRLMHYDQDFKSEITMYLIELIHRMDLSKFHIQSDYALINYIKKSLYHHYILLSSGLSEQRRHESHFDSEVFDDCTNIDYTTDNEISDLFLDSIMKQHLTPKEYMCVKLIVIHQLSSSEAAKILGIARQTANETKLRALKKLKSLLF